MVLQVLHNHTCKYPDALRVMLPPGAELFAYLAASAWVAHAHADVSRVQ
jgi:hypothetical protein